MHFFDQISSSTKLVQMLSMRFHRQLVERIFGATFAIVPVGGMGGGNQIAVDEILFTTFQLVLSHRHGMSMSFKFDELCLYV
jgi:hypothetical protein